MLHDQRQYVKIGPAQVEAPIIGMAICRLEIRALGGGLVKRRKS